MDSLPDHPEARAFTWNDGPPLTAVILAAVAASCSPNPDGGGDGGSDTAVDASPALFESVDSSKCLSERQWTAGNRGSRKMHPGRACMDCHDDEDEAPAFYSAGTVYGGYQQSDDCAGVEGATVRLEGEKGETLEATTNEAGNFAIRKARGDLETPIQVTVAYDGESHEMPSPLYDNRDCNFCHTSERTSGRDPGRVVTPGVQTN